MKDNDYPYLRLWGREMGSKPYYIADQVERARRDKAPPDAIFERFLTPEGTRGSLGTDYTWARFRDLPSTHVFRDRAFKAGLEV